jgi:parallel beta-helix repeat protein
MRRASIASLLAAALLMALAGTPAVAQDGVTITVDTTSDVVDFGGAQMVADLPGPDGLTSLREATIASTNTTGPETIAFDIPTSDPGFTGEEFVIGIDPDPVPQRVAYGLEIGDDATTIDATTQPGGFPIVVEGGPQSTSDPDGGLRITSSGNQVIGLGVRGYANGIDVDGGSTNRIVDVTATGNANAILFSGRGTGTGGEVSASTVRDNLRIGIGAINTADIVIDGNTITGNGNEGVFIQNGDRVTVTDNLISGSGFAAILHQGGVGGTIAGNTITDNDIWGIMVQGGNFSQQLTFTRNSIANNGALGIDLLGGKEDPAGSPGGGVTRNDSAHDRDTGANGLLNYPERLMATDDGTATAVEGRVDVPDPQSLMIELFANEAPDPSGFGEGETFLATATPDAKGRFTATLPAGLAGQWLTATSTDTLGNTSEFSEASQVTVPRR